MINYHLLKKGVAPKENVVGRKKILVILTTALFLHGSHTCLISENYISKALTCNFKRCPFFFCMWCFSSKMDDLLGIPVAVNIECAAGVTDNGTAIGNR